MGDSITPEVTPEKIYPFLKQADPDQLETLYRLSYHLIRGNAPDSKIVPLKEFLSLLEDGSSRQRLLIHQAAFHLVHKGRMT